MCSIGTGQLVTHANNFLGQLVICDELTVSRVDRYPCYKRHLQPPSTDTASDGLALAASTSNLVVPPLVAHPLETVSLP